MADGSNRTSFSVPAGGGERLKGWYWPVDGTKANLTVMTGMNEYALRYGPFALWMNEHGVNVWVLDAFGQGENAASIAEQEIWPENAFVRQVDAIHEMLLLAKENGLPTTIMGHSMGSFLTQSHLCRYPGSEASTILMGSNGGQASLMKTGYMLSRILVHRSNRDRPNALLTSISLGSYAKAIKDRKSVLDWLSYNEDNVNAYRDDPYCGHPNTGGFWKEFMKGMSLLWDPSQLANISPNERIFIVAGSDDPVGQCGKGIHWLYDMYREHGVKDVQMKLYDHMRHEILNEAESETVRNDLLSFIMCTGR